MKKLTSLIIAVVLIGSPLSLVHAQTTPSTRITINTAQLQELLTLLLSELALLEQEYNSLATAQANTTQELSQIASSTVATTTAVATTSPTLSQLESVVPQVVQTTTVNHPIVVASTTQPVASAPAPVVPTSTMLISPTREIIEGNGSIGYLDQPTYQLQQMGNLLNQCFNSISSQDNGFTIAEYLTSRLGTISAIQQWGITSLLDATDTTNGDTELTFTPSLQQIAQNNITSDIQRILTQYEPYVNGVQVPADPSTYTTSTNWNGYWEYQELLNVQSTTYPIVCGNIEMR